MKLRFTKMQGLGNDFVMIDAISQKVTITPERACKLADRHFGVGCDQVLVVEPPSQPDADFRYRIFNQDGNEVEHGGDGARCFAVFVRQRKLTGKKRIVAETAAGNLVLDIQPNNQVRVNLGAPKLEPKAIPFEAKQQATSYDIADGRRTFQISAVSLGNPHAVIAVEDVQTFDVPSVGSRLESHPRFPHKVNVNFMQILKRNEINLRVFERGVGETLACGTGACAAVVAGCLRQLLDSNVTVHLPGGNLQVQWQGRGKPVFMTGPANTVFHGQINL